MAVGKTQLDGVLAHRFNGGDGDVLLAGLQYFLSGAMTAHFGGRRVDAQEFTGQAEGFAVGKGNFQRPRGLVQGDFGGLGHAFAESSHVSLFRKRDRRHIITETGKSE